MPLYFAYGSNMSLRQMQRRCPTAQRVGIGLLANHVLAFTRFSQGRRCGVADVLPHPSQEVWGVLFEVNSSDLRSLDASEGFHGAGQVNAYDRSEITVLREGDPAQPVRAELYVVQEKSPESLRPNQDYQALLVEGATENGLPESYCTMLRQLEVM